MVACLAAQIGGVVYAMCGSSVDSILHVLVRPKAGKLDHDAPG
jgi:hypothetical protein